MTDAAEKENAKWSEAAERGASRRRFGVGAIALVLVLGSALGGYFRGREDASTYEDQERVFAEAYEAAAASSAAESQALGMRQGLRDGRASGEESAQLTGEARGKGLAEQEIARADAALASSEATDSTAAAQAEATALEYTDSLPNGEPGYVLPEDQRSLACVGIDAETGECVGD